MINKEKLLKQIELNVNYTQTLIDKNRKSFVKYNKLKRYQFMLLGLKDELQNDKDLRFGKIFLDVIMREVNDL
jgi:hypothetical protein